jgi:ATP-dependent Clp protease ATP-binding subunit ClpC
VAAPHEQADVVSKKSLRIYFQSHDDGRRTGTLMRHGERLFDAPPPSAYGSTEDEVRDRLAGELRKRTIADGDDVSRYLWDDDFQTGSISVSIHPHSVVDKQPVVGTRRIPLRLTYAWSKLEGGAYRVVLPRFAWWFVLEDLSIAPEVIRHAVSTALLGESPRWGYDFRAEGPEYISEWSVPEFTERAEHAPGETEEELPTTAAVAEEWVALSSRGKLPALVGSDEVFDLTVAALLGDPPPSILLVGAPGVGKTTWVQRLARRLLQRRREGGPPTRLFATSADRVVAGMVYLGQWQERCLSLVEELAHEGDLLYLDRLLPVLAAQPDGTSIADLIGPAVAGGEISLIAECTPAELERARRLAPDFVERFQIVRLSPAAPDAMPSLVQKALERRLPGLVVHPDALRRMVQHLDAFQRDLELPGKAFRFVDWLVRERAESPSGTLYPADVSRLYARYSGLAVELIAEDRPAGPEAIAAELARGVVGQDEACLECGRILARFKAGLNDPDRPLGSVFFVGPTGVGKTELAKQLARYLFGARDRMVRLDMSEYGAPGASARMLAVGKGVRSLAEQVRRQPLSLVLFDEIEKAHPETFDLLLGLLGEGRLTDAEGRLVDFRMCFVIMTSNLGVAARPAVGFGGEHDARFEQSVRRHFRPEFFNRIDRVVSFRRLGSEEIQKIVDLELAAAAERAGLTRRALRLAVTERARLRLAELGVHPAFGARPLKRVIEERVITPIAVRLAADPSLSDRTLLISAEGEAEGDVVLPSG